MTGRGHSPDARGGRANAVLDEAGARSRILDEFERGASALAERMVSELASAIPAYAAFCDETLAHVRQVISVNVAALIASLRERRSLTAEERAFVRDNAARRAQEGVTLAELLAAYRVGSQCAWDDICAIIGADDGLVVASLGLATDVLRFNDEIAAIAADGFADEFARITSDRDTARRDFLESALAGGLSPGETEARATALGLDASAPHVLVLFVAEGEPGRSLQRHLAALLTTLANGRRALVVGREAELVAVIPCDAGDEGRLAEGVRRLAPRVGSAGVLSGISRAHESLSALPEAYRQASLALAAAKSGLDVAVYGEILVEELILRDPAVARRLVRAMLDPVLAHRDMLTTLLAFIDAGPSLPAVAERLSVHPNTVAYRLTRIRDVTGRDPRLPLGVADLALAVRAARLLGELPPAPRPQP